jgi:serine/threonine-protein kinase
MGVVEGVWDADLMRELAIKRVRPEMRDDARVIAMFLWEARVTAYLDHPNIVPVHDLGRTAAGDPYFAMKRVSGVSLEHVLIDLRANESAKEQWSVARSPVLDLKPWVREFAPRGAVRQPDWMAELMRDYF